LTKDTLLRFAYTLHENLGFAHRWPSFNVTGYPLASSATHEPAVVWYGAKVAALASLMEQSTPLFVTAASLQTTELELRSGLTTALPRQIVRKCPNLSAPPK
jgi:hypothetical protein